MERATAVLFGKWSEARLMPVVFVAKIAKLAAILRKIAIYRAWLPCC